MSQAGQCRVCIPGITMGRDLDRESKVGVLVPGGSWLGERGQQGGLSSTHSFISLTLCNVMHTGDLLHNRGLPIYTISLVHH